MERDANGREDELLITYLRRAKPVGRAMRPEDHPDSATLTAFCRQELGEDVSSHVRVHLFECDECYAIAQKLERILDAEADEARIVTAARDTVENAVSRIRGTLGSVVEKVICELWGLAEGRAGLAEARAASKPLARPTSESFREGDLEVTVYVNHYGHLVATCEVGKAAVEGAEISVVEVDTGGGRTVLTAGCTDAVGDADLGEYDALIRAARPGRHVVQVRFAEG